MNQVKQRRIVLIDHRFQLRMAAAFVALQILLTALFAVGLYLFMDSEIHADLASAHASYQSLSQMLLPIVVVLAAFSVTLSIILVTLFVIRISHKVAGPIYRFRTVLESLAQRRIDPMTRIRPDDQLAEFAISLDKALGSVKTDVQVLQQAAIRLQAGHDKGDSNAVATEISLIASTVNAWNAGEPNSN